MKKAKLYPPILNEFRSMHRQAMRYFNDHNFSDRMKLKPDFQHKVYPNVNAWHDGVERQGIVDYEFRNKWRVSILKTLEEKVKAIDVDDYNQCFKLFNAVSFKDTNEADTPAARLEREITNLERIISWLSEKYQINEGEGFRYNRTSSKLMRGSELIADYSVGKRKDSNPQKLLETLFKNKAVKLRQEQIAMNDTSDNRAVEQAMRAINKVAGAKLVKKDYNRYSHISEFYLNSDLLE